MRMSGGAALVEVLRAQKVPVVFGLIGSSTMEIFDALYEAPDIAYVGVRHEAAGTHMADAFARVSGSVGVLLAGQNGPGATNLVTGLAQAYLAFSPVVAIAGYPTSSHVDRGTFQEIDQQALFTPITKKTFTVHSASRLPEYLLQACRIARTGRPGPVVVNVPRDLLATEIDGPTGAEFADCQVYPSAPSPASLQKAISLLAQSERPLIIAGGGVTASRSSRQLVELGERLGAPIAAAAGHPDVIPNDHPLYAGQVGPRGNRVATDMALRADVILALGTRLGFNTTFFSHDNLGKDARIIQVEVDAQAVGRHFPVDVGIVSNAGLALDALCAFAWENRPSTRERWTQEFHSSMAALLAERQTTARQSGKALHPAAVCAAIQSVLPRRVIVTLDAGTCCLQATDLLRTFEAPSVITPLDFGLVGFSFAAGMGAKAAAPSRPVLSLIGDGGFGMTMGEIGTAILHGLNTVTLIMNNGCWGAEKAYQRDFYSGRYVGSDLTNPNFADVANASGATGVRAETATEVSEALAAAFERNGPTIIDVPVDPDAIVSFRRDSFAHRQVPPTLPGA